jgi:hypothetical protein
MPDIYGHTIFSAEDTDETILYTCPVVSAAINVAGPGGAAEDIVTYAQQETTQTRVTSIIATTYLVGTDYRMFITPLPDDAPSVLDSGGSGADYALVWDKVAAANSTDMFAGGMVLAPGNTIWIKAGAVDEMTFSIFYIETS